MKKFSKVIGSAIGVAAALALSVSTTQAANILTDPGFESGAFGQLNPILLPGGVGGGWAGFNGAAYANAAAETGSWGIQEAQGIGAAWNFMGAYQVVGGVSAGQSYTLTADFMTPTGISAGVGTYVPAVIQLTYFNAAGADLGTVETGGVGAKAIQYRPAAANIWYTGTVTATAPVGAVYVAPYLAFMENGSQTAADTLYWDNGSLTLVPEPSTLALLGMGLGLPFYFWRRRNS